MDLVVSWLLFPLTCSCSAPAAACSPTGSAGGATPGPLVPLLGFAVVVVVAQFLPARRSDRRVGDAGGRAARRGRAWWRAGGASARGSSRSRSPPPPASSAVYAAPIVLVGRADDRRLHPSSTTPRPGSRSPIGSSSTAATSTASRPPPTKRPSHFNLGDGYPIGAFVPLGGRRAGCSPSDPAWLIQPYAAFVAALLALGLWSLATPLRAVAGAARRGRVRRARNRRCCSATTCGAGSRR